jgi:coproporphyrinogen III oxidase-like Fe-S oxidoreductase
MKTSTKYFENLREEIKILKSHNVKIDSIYIGGGSPLINDVELLKTLKLLKKCFDVDDVSCETDPNHIEVETVKKLKGYVRRLSIGVQSFNDTLLKQLGRFDKFGDSKSLIKKIKAVQGILPMTNIDLIFNLPNQTEKMLRDDIKIAKSLGVEQVVAYPLMSSTLNSKFTNRFEPNNNKEHFYNIINEELKDYHANNMWSFSRDKVNMNDEYISTHNEYIGLGSGAFSYLEGKLFINAFDLEKYEELLKTKKDTILAKSEFSKKNVIQYYILCTLFSGTFDIKAYNKKFKISLEKVLGKELFILKNFGIIQI